MTRLLRGSPFAALLVCILILLYFPLDPKATVRDGASRAVAELIAPNRSHWNRSAQPRAALGPMPLLFTANQEQLDDQVIYYARGGDLSLFFTVGGVTFALAERSDRKASGGDGSLLRQEANVIGSARPTRRWSLKLDFVGANSSVRPTGQERTTTTVNYFRGPRQQWKAGLPVYSRVVYADLWPGIDLVYAGDQSQLKYTLMVRPGANPSVIKLRYRGATSVRLNDKGQLEIATPAGSLIDDAPYSYQVVGGRQQQVASAYLLDASTLTFGFAVEGYDRNQPLILDPTVLVFAGYIGGEDVDHAHSIVVDSTGNIYIAGQTTSDETTFPVNVGPDVTYNLSSDVFVAKLKPDGTGLIYLGYIGGARSESAGAIAVDKMGNLFVVGHTGSTEASFPEVGGPDLTHNGSSDAFVAKVSADGTDLLYAGYIGGAGEDVGTGIALDKSGNAYVSGWSSFVSDGTFPVNVGPDLTYNGGSSDGFIAKVRADGSALVYAGYIGGDKDDFGGNVGGGIAVDNDGNAIVTGATTSSETSFPVLVGPDLTHNGDNDAFVAKVKADGSGLIYCGYIGGAAYDAGSDIAIDDSGNAYINGSVTSTEATFPILIGPDLRYNGGQDAFVAKVRADGTALVYAGYVGGTMSEGGTGIAVDEKGSAYVTGNTSSSEATFPARGGPDVTYNGNGDAFIVQIQADGRAVVSAGYVGGAALDTGLDIALDTAANAYIIGQTSSSQTTFPAIGGPDVTFNGGVDGFVAKIGKSLIYIPLVRK
jgi:hypothetical protein